MLRIQRFSPVLGAEIHGIDLAKGLDADAYQQIRQALLEHQVLFFRDQHEMPPGVQIANGEFWHSDVTFTTRINEPNDDESEALLEFLFSHSEKIEFRIRYRWKQNDVAFWDNRCTMHHAIWDYWPHERKGRRVTIKGDRPT